MNLVLKHRKENKSMRFKRFIVNFTILDYTWKPFFKIMKYNKPVGRIYNIFIGFIFITIIKKSRHNN